MKSAFKPSGPSGQSLLGFLSMKQLQCVVVFLPPSPPSLDGMLVHRKVTVSIKFIHLCEESSEVIADLSMYADCMRHQVIRLVYFNKCYGINYLCSKRPSEDFQY